MYKQQFYIVAKKDKNIESPNFNKFLALRTDKAGTIDTEEEKWTDNIFLAKHFYKEKDAVCYASKQLNTNFLSLKSNTNIEHIDSGLKIVKIYFDIEGNSEITSILYTN